MNGIWFRYLKRPFDLCVSLGMLVVLAPLMLLTAAAVRVRLGSPVLFSQIRLGRGRETFRLYKFRSMNDARGADGELLPDAKRLTPFGQWLRTTSLDELPQLINILRGDMSLIGPRATLPSYEDHLRAEYPERFLVPPGLTSLPAVKGRNLLSSDEKFGLDIDYVRRAGFLMDAYILVMTIPVVLGRKGIDPAAGSPPASDKP